MLALTQASLVKLVPLLKGVPMSTNVLVPLNTMLPPSPLSNVPLLIVYSVLSTRLVHVVPVPE
jgi:hypothetical protein